MEVLSEELTSYKITTNITQNILECWLEYGSKVFYTEVYSSDLQTGLVSLSKLENIIKANSKQIQPYFTIWLDLILCEISNSNNLVLNILFSNEFVEFEEKIYFKEKQILLNELEPNSELESNSKLEPNNKLEQIIKLQNEKINQFENTIIKMNEIVEKLKTQVEKLESEQCYQMVGGLFNFSEYIPKNINVVTLCIIDSATLRAEIEYRDKLGKKQVRCINFSDKGDELMFFNIKKIRIGCYQGFEYNFLDIFIDNYLRKKKDFIVEEIVIFSNIGDFVNTLLKYTNYNKLVIKYNERFNYDTIKDHCTSNNIIFDYC